MDYQWEISPRGVRTDSSRTVTFLLAVVLLTSWIGMPAALAAGQAVPSGCDPTLDAGFLYTCQTARYSQYGYTASGLTVWVQATLDGHGYTLTKDGYFGPLTDSKVRQWQTARGLTSDGIVGNNTWVTLDPFGLDPRWVVSVACNMTTGVTIYRTNGAQPYQYGLMACRDVGVAPKFLAANDFCAQTEGTGGRFVPGNWRDPSQFATYGDCRDYWAEEL